MVTSVECLNCGTPHGIDVLLDSCATSSTAASVLHFSCPECLAACPIAVQADRVAWAGELPIESWLAVPGLEVLAFPGFVHVWYAGRHWAMADRHMSDAH
jgi:hypothetical protein